MIRGKAVEEAMQILQFQPKRAAKALSKVLMSAIANATHDRKVSAEDLVVTNVAVDGGPTQKRWMPRSMGRSSRILRRTSHITVSVGEPQ